MIILPLPPERAARLLARAALRVQGDVAGHDFHGNQWTIGETDKDASTEDKTGEVTIEGAPEVRERVQGVLDKIPDEILEDAPSATIHAFATQEETTAKIDEYLLKNYGFTSEGQARNLVDRELGHVFTAANESDLVHGYARLYSEKIESPEWVHATPDLSMKQREDAFVAGFARLVMGHPAQQVMSLTNPFTAILERHAVQAALKKWRWAAGTTKLPSVVITRLDGTTWYPNVKRIRGAGEGEGHEFHGNQWTSTTSVFSKAIVSLPLHDFYNAQKESEQEVKIANLHPTQRILNPNHPGSGKIPQVLQLSDGRLLITDGHHTLAAAVKRGEKTAKVKLITLAGEKAGITGQKLQGAEAAGHEFHGNQYTAGSTSPQPFETHPYLLKTPTGKVLSYHATVRDARREASMHARTGGHLVDVIHRFNSGTDGSIVSIVHPSGAFSSEGKPVKKGDRVEHEGRYHRVTDVIGRMAVIQPIGDSARDNYTHSVMAGRLTHLEFNTEQPRDGYGRWAPGERSDNPGLISHKGEVEPATPMTRYVEAALRGDRTRDAHETRSVSSRNKAVREIEDTLEHHGFKAEKIEKGPHGGVLVREYHHPSGVVASVAYSSAPDESGMFNVNLLTWVSDAGHRAAGESEGHEFHGNQWTNASGPSMRLTDPNPSWALGELGARGESQLAYARQNLKAAAERLDFPPEKVRIELYDRRFTRGGQEFREAGHYSHQDQEITLSAASLVRYTPRDAEELLAHEVSHRDWADVHAQFLAEGPPPDLEFDQQEDVPSSIKVQDILSDRGFELQKEDGITEYSRAYWKEVPVSPYEAKIMPYSTAFGGKILDPDFPWIDESTGELFKTREQADAHAKRRHDEMMNWPPDDYDYKFNRAVDETLGEIAAVDVGRSYGRPPDGKTSFDPSPTWRQLSVAVKKAAKELREFKKGLITRGNLHG